MEWIVQLLEPSGPLGDWVVRASIICWAPFLIVWVIALVFSRCMFIFGQDPLIRAYFAWGIPLIGYAMLLAFVVIRFSQVLQRTGEMFGYSLAPFIPCVVSSLLAIDMSKRIMDRAKRLS